MDSGIWQIIATAGGVVGLIVLIIGVVVRRFVTPYLKRVLGAAQDTQAEVKNNGGASMKDQLDRVEKKIDNVDERQRQHGDRLTRLEVRFNHLGGG